MMTKTDKNYFVKLSHDLVNGIISAATAGESFNNCDDFKAEQKRLAEIHNKTFDHHIHLYERGLITRDECFKLMLDYYAVSV